MRTAFWFLAAALLVLVPGAVMAEWQIGGTVDLNYIKNTGEGSTHDAYFASKDSELRVWGDFANGMTGKLVLSLIEESLGTESGGFVVVQEMWAEQKGLMGVDKLRVRIGKLEIPCTLNYAADVGITNNLTDGFEYGSPTSFEYVGPGRIDFTYGATFGYEVGMGFGEVLFSTFEGEGGTDVSGDDNDPGILKSYALQWDNRHSAFGIEQFGLVVGLAKISNGYKDGKRTLASVGVTGTVPDKGITVAFEYSQSMFWQAIAGNPLMLVGLTDLAENDEGTLLALVVDFNRDPFRFMMRYEQFAGQGDYADTITRISFMGEQAVAEDYFLVIQVSDFKFKEAPNSDMTQWCAGMRGEF